MQKTAFIILFVAISILTAGPPGEAFVPETPHLLYLVTNKIRIPAGMTVSQTRTISAGAVQGIESEPVTARETLTYLFPTSLRSESRSGSAEQFYVISDAGFVKVVNGRVTGLERSPGDYYTDPLLYRDYERMSRVLETAGVDVHRVTFQRMDGGICYFIGQPYYDQPPQSGLWIEKDSFLPVRYRVRKGGRTVDVRYGSWQRVSRSWYPRETRIFVDDELHADIRVDRMVLRTDLPASLFDVEKILGQYPRAAQEIREETGSETGVENLDKELETFNKLYD